MYKEENRSTDAVQSMRLYMKSNQGFSVFLAKIIRRELSKNR